MSLAALLLLTLYGPLSVTALSVRSQRQRLAELVAGPREAEKTDREASAALRFLLEHGDQDAVAAAIPGGLPTLDWDSLPRSREHRDQAATRILAGAQIAYVSEYPRGSVTGDAVQLSARTNSAMPTAGYDWMLDASASDRMPRLAGADSVSVRFDATFSVAHVMVGADSLAFDLGRLARMLAGKSVVMRSDIPIEDLRLEASTRNRRGALVLQSMSGRRMGD